MHLVSLWLNKRPAFSDMMACRLFRMSSLFILIFKDSSDSGQKKKGKKRKKKKREKDKANVSDSDDSSEDDNRRRRLDERFVHLNR